MSSRRHFLLGTAGSVAAGHLAAKRASANDTIRVAILGVHGRGKDHMQGFHPLPNVKVAVLCDPDRQVLEQRAKEFGEQYNQTFELEQDLRKVFERKDIDAVSVATPNHWHSLATIWACQAGKDVYVEKPGSHNIYEGRKMVEAAHKYKRIVQHGVQLRSSPALREAVQLLRDGIIGNVYMSRGLVFRWRPSIGKKPVEPVPPYLDYDIWTGPAQQEPLLPPHRPLQLALDLELWQRRRRQPGYPRDRHVHVGPGPGEVPVQDHRDGAANSFGTTTSRRPRC